jgi:UDP-N-acetylglucosamine 2-epimerase (non-hydrolysing)/UDP-GlcNAc3NAcA epimerase
MKIITVLGARPQFIKAAPVSIALREKGHKEFLVHTGQHYDYRMSKIFFDELGLQEPGFHLGVGSGVHGRQTGLILQRVEGILLQQTPDVVIVYGDTNSTLGGTLAAAKLHIPVVHVEAGLRSFNKRMPEEINRVLTDHMSTFLFCPSHTAMNNLQKEGFPIDGKMQSLHPDIDHPIVVHVGDVMYDTLLHALQIAEQKSLILEQLGLQEKSYALLTLHRAENTDERSNLERIIAFINDVTRSQPVIFPMHPRMTKVYKNSSSRFAKHVRIVEPLGYFDLHLLLKYAVRLFTDSGGMQKEAYWLRVPCITLREETEWVETVQSGWNILYRDYQDVHHPKKDANAYGDGHAAERIISTLCKSLNHN